MTDVPEGSAAALGGVPCLVLVGGLGTRLRSVLSDLPKPMAVIAGKPFLEYLIRWLRKSGVQRLILCSGYRSEKIQQYFRGGETFDLQITYSVEREPQGTWGAIRQAGQFFTERNFLVINGDSWLQVDLGRLIDFHNHRRAVATIAAVEVSDSLRYGSLDIASSSGRILAFHEKRATRNTLINGGVYVFSREVFSIAPPTALSLEKEVFPMLLPHGVFAMPVQGYFVDIGLPEEYKKLEDNAQNWVEKLDLRNGGARAC